jgi:hypothetical protein
MHIIALELPPIETENNVEVSISINGHRNVLAYRVEVFQWEDWWQPPEPRARAIQRILAAHDTQWQLMHIGTPVDSGIPLTFRRIS